MKNSADILMLTGIVHFCSDCGGSRIFVAPQGCDEGSDESLNESTAGCDFACTECGAALLVDPCLFVDTGALKRADPTVHAAYA